MPDIMLKTQLRTLKGKGVRALRRQGLVPAHVYGRGIESLPLQFDLRDLREVLQQAGATTIVELHVTGADGRDDGRRHLVLIDTIQRDPARGRVLHVDFRQVELDRPVRAAVPIVLTGEAPAARQGAVVVQALDTLEVEALPRALPHEILVDLSGLTDLDSQIAVGDLSLPAGVEAQADAETIVVSVVASRVEREVEAEAAAEVAGEEAAGGEAPAEGEAEREAPDTAGE
jgi:large subunit ribosomal protein L25